MKRTERVSFYTHFAGFLAAIVGTVFLIYVSKWSASRIVVSSVYGFSLMFLFLASSLYHAFKTKENENSFWRKLDHIAIFFLIAGTYTPISYIYLSGPWRWTIIGVQWGLVLAGFFFKVFWMNAPRWLYTTIYLLMGWVGIMPVHKFITTMPISSMVFVVLGGLSFTVGAVFYMLKRPVIRPGFGFHEIFHLFILAGGALHYLAVLIAVVR